MDEPRGNALQAYVRAAGVLHGMVLPPEREALVVAVVGRLAEFADDLAAFALADDDEPGGIFVP